MGPSRKPICKFIVVVSSGFKEFLNLWHLLSHVLLLNYYFAFFQGLCFRLQHFLESLCHCWHCAADFQWEEKWNPQRYSRLGIWGFVSLPFQYSFLSLWFQWAIFFLLTSVNSFSKQLPNTKFTAFVFFQNIPEEVFASYGGIWWSTTGKFLAYGEFNDTEVQQVEYTWYGAEQYPHTVAVPYPKVQSSFFVKKTT